MPLQPLKALVAIEAGKLCPKWHTTHCTYTRSWTSL